MDSDEYRRDQTREKAFIDMATRDTTQKKDEPKPAPISIGDPDQMDSFTIDPSNFGQVAPIKQDIKPPVKEAPKQESGIVIDPKTGKKVYKGPKLKSRKVVDGKEWTH